MFTDPVGAMHALALQQTPILQHQITDEDRLSQQEEASQDQYRKFMAQLIKQEGVSADDLKPWNAEQEMAKRRTNLWEQFGSPGFVVAMLASAFTAKPMNSALQAGGAAMNAINQGDMNAYNKAFEAWKDNTDLAIKRMNMEHEQFQDIAALSKTDMEQFHERLQTMLTKYGDQRKLMMLNAGLDDEVVKSFAALGQAIPQLQNAQQAIEMNEIRRRLVMKEIGNNKDPKSIIAATQRAEELIAATQAPKTPEAMLWNEFILKNPNASLDDKTKFYQQLEQAKHPSIWGTARGPDTVQQIGDGVISGKLPPDLSRLYGMSGPVQAYLSQKGFNLTQADLEFQSAKKQVQSLNGPQMIRFVGLASSVNNTIEEVRRLSQQMQFSGIPALNHIQLMSYVQTEGNSKKGQQAAQYLAAVNTLKEEFANLAQGGYAPHEAVWALANQQINGNYGIDELNSSLTEIRRLINYRLQGIPGIGQLGPGAVNPYTGYTGAGAGSSEQDPMGIR